MDDITKLIITTQDPENGVLAASTLLFKVCDGDNDRFEEACRLIELIVNKALEAK